MLLLTVKYGQYVEFHFPGLEKPCRLYFKGPRSKIKIGVDGPKEVRINRGPDPGPSAVVKKQEKKAK